MRRLTRLAAMLAAMACIGANAMADGMRESERMRATWWRGTPPAGDLLSISAATIEEPDIVWSQRVPWLGEEVTISARVRGEGAGAFGPTLSKWLPCATPNGPAV